MLLDTLKANITNTAIIRWGNTAQTSTDTMSFLATLHFEITSNKKFADMLRAQHH